MSARERHVTRLLAARRDGELDARTAAEVDAHLATCAACRGRAEIERTGHLALGGLPRAEARPFDADWAPAAAAGARRRIRRALIAAAVAAVAVTAALAWRSQRVPGWDVAALDGAPHVDGEPVAGEATLRRGEWLETDGASRARLAIGHFGQLDVRPDSRLRLVRTGGWLAWMREASHRVELRRGSISARVVAPPRLFVVDTPSATAVDLGCAYVLEVGDDGAGRLEVTSGRVALERGARESIVMAGDACAIRPGTGPGTPWRADAAAALREALARFDVGAPTAAADLEIVLATARPRDAVTVWHLVPRSEGGERERVVERLARIVTAPTRASATRDALLALEPEALEAWRRAAESARWQVGPGS